MYVVWSDVTAIRRLLIVFKEKKDSKDGWDRIGLSYKVEWPFNSLITPKVLKK